MRSFGSSRSLCAASIVSLVCFTMGTGIVPGAARAQTPPAAPAAPAPAPAPAPAASAYSIPEGTPIKVTLQKELKSGTAKEGEAVPFVVAQDVTGPNGQVYIKAGTPATGKVTQSKPHGFIGKPGKLEFTCDYVTLPGGGQIPLRSSEKTKYGQDNRAASVAAAVVLTPIALLVPGKDTTAREGQQFTLYADKTSNVAANGTVTTVAAAPAAPTPPATGTHSRFALSDGTTVVGTLRTFDGTTYTIDVDGGGSRALKAADVKSISPAQ